MPTYDYECTECKDRFEAFQSMTDEPITVCKKCGGKVRKLIGAGAGIIFKGSGFYVNDYKKSSAAANSPGASKNTSGNDKSDSSSSADAKTSSPTESTASAS
ncbi:MAG: hypothetical protein JW864_04180 [Spirochaetes bacterium]|nr:hypothetical protein [Spirochaetota bacterium]